MKTDEILQKEVQEAIKWEPLMNAAEIGVAVVHGIVTLTGTVDSYAKKSEAENAAKGVAGVQAVVEKIQIRLDESWKINDHEIAEELLNAFKWDWQIPSDKLNIKVENGWITLEGELQWNFQKKAAEQSVTNLIGVKGLVNKITIRSETHDEIEKKDIERALRRNWALSKLGINVEVVGNRVQLNGKVLSLYQKEECERIAWNTPGVCTIDNQLLIEYHD